MESARKEKFIDHLTQVFNRGYLDEKLKAHDEANASRVGDRVLIEETKPISKDKRWRIREILR